MAHPRESIVEYVVALLVAASTAADSRVTKTQVDPFRNPDKTPSLPALAVYALNDPNDAEASSEMEIAHDLELEIVAWVVGSDAIPPDEAANTLALEVETAIRADEYLGGNASLVEHKGTVVEIFEAGRTARLFGTAVLTYSVKYHIALAAT